ncbi:hypothetical protein HAX54_008004, partial [Datura stramonium]|nr:hypothetical protein [Datura stramonium]
MSEKYLGSLKNPRYSPSRCYTYNEIEIPYLELKISSVCDGHVTRRCPCASYRSGVGVEQNA